MHNSNCGIDLGYIADLPRKVVRKNRLLSKEHRAYMGERVDESRCSGRSVALALNSVAGAIQCPNQDIPLYDHFGSRGADLNLLALCQSTVAQLGLKFFVFTKSNPSHDGRPTIRCDRLE